MPNGEGFGLVRRTESGHEQVSVEHALEWIMTMESQLSLSGASSKDEHDTPPNVSPRCVQSGCVLALGTKSLCTVCTNSLRVMKYTRDEFKIQACFTRA
mmetsp:Transcript_69036/g.112046  ORF Transcript_69036/g.112046 Transcript_69036/m.112046 type:complete len:99 (+) Transcript_69036:178-474(+)